MKFSKKLIILSAAAVLLLATSATVFAATSGDSPAEIFARLTNRSTDSVIEQRAQTQQRYGEMAEGAGISQQFKEETTELMQTRLKERVQAGTMTQAQADEVLQRIQENQENCDGDCDNATGTQGIGGIRFGSGAGGFGGGDKDGSCITDEE